MVDGRGRVSFTFYQPFIRVVEKKGFFRLEVRFHDHTVAFRDFRDRRKADEAKSLLLKDLAEAPNGDVIGFLKSWGEYVDPKIYLYTRSVR